MTETIILTLTPHPVWGYILQPLIAQVAPEGWLTILEPASSDCPILAGQKPETFELIRLAEKFSDKNLMQKFSKEKSVADFLKKVKPETIETLIRPYIETYQRKMAQLWPKTGMEFYQRKTVKVRTLHDRERIEGGLETAEPIFHFDRDEDSFRYYVQLRIQDEEVNLHLKHHHVICQTPAILIVRNQLVACENTDCKKIIPFFTRKQVEVPMASYTSYMKSFVLNCLASNTVETTGLPIEQIVPEKRIELTIGQDEHESPLFTLHFYYEGERITPEQSGKKIVTVDESGDEVALHWFSSDAKWEKKTIKQLTDSGLEKCGANQFCLRKSASSGKSAPILMDWMQANAEMLEQFHFTQK
jgi:hypothetical protein